MREEGVAVPPPMIDFARKIKDILKHVGPLVDEARAPILHYRRTVADIWGMLAHVETGLGSSGIPEAAVDRHLDRLYLMVVGRAAPARAPRGAAAALRAPLPARRRAHPA